MFFLFSVLEGDYTTCMTFLMRYPGAVDITYIIENALFLRDPHVGIIIIIIIIIIIKYAAYDIPSSPPTFLSWNSLVAPFKNSHDAVFTMCSHTFTLF